MSILALQKRQRELGRLRLGTKGDKGQPVKLDTWRITSQDKQLIEQVAGEYGGTVQAWNDQWEVITDTAKIPVLIPDQDMERQQNMELWAAGGLVRRCDGSHCLIATGQPGTFIESDCLCADMETPECKPSTIVRFWLPDIKALGVWTLTSTGWNAASELAADVDLLAGKNVLVYLAIEKREIRQKGQPLKKFVVPVIQTPVSLRQLLDARATLGLPVPSAPVTGVLPSPREEERVEIVADDTSTDDVGLVVTIPGLDKLVGEDANETGDGGTLIAGIAERAIERYWSDLIGLIAAGSPDGTMDENEVRLRRLFRLLEQVGVVESGDGALHAALSKRGASHVGDLRAAELRAFCGDAWLWAEKMAVRNE